MAVFDSRIRMADQGIFCVITKIELNSITVMTQEGETRIFTILDPWSQFIKFLRIRDEIYIEVDFDSSILDETTLLVIEPRYLVNVTDTIRAISCPREVYVKYMGADADYDPVLHQKMVKGNLLHDLFTERLIHQTPIEEAIDFTLEKNNHMLVLANLNQATARQYLNEDGTPLRGISLQGESEISIRHYGYGLSGRLDGFVGTPMVLELKSSRIPSIHPSPDHNIQMNIYLEMMKSRVSKPLKGMVIYASDQNIDFKSPTDWSHQTTIISRNYTYLVHSGRYIPPVLRGEDKKACRSCYRAKGCHKLCAGLLQQRDCEDCYHDIVCSKREWEVTTRAFFKDLTMATVEEEKEAKLDEYLGLRSHTGSNQIDEVIVGKRIASSIDAHRYFTSEYTHETSETRYRRGDFVTIYPAKILSEVSEISYNGIILDITPRSILLQSVNQLPEKVQIYPSNTSSLQQRSRDIIFKTINYDAKILRSILDALVRPEFDFNPFKSEELTLIEPIKKYNKLQEKAIKSAIQTQDIFLIQGPAGTGKTSVIVEVIHQLVLKGRSVLVSAYTNMAVDNVALKLIEEEIEFIRLGSLGSSPVVIKKYGIENKQRRFREFTEGNKEGTVILATTSTIGNNIYDDLYVDYVIIDEASQQTLPHSLMPIYHGQKAVLVGDHAQLPAIVRSETATQLGLDRSLFERLTRFQSRFMMLEEQYRMSDQILALPNRLFYNGKLRSANEKIASQSLEFGSNLIGEESYQLIALETGSLNIDQRNYDEASVIIHVVHQLLSQGNVNKEEIAIITPFRAQVALLRDQLPDMMIDTIDRFQGSEAEIVIFSTTTVVDIPILSDKRRINVALTRAKTKLIVLQTTPSRIREPTLMRELYRDSYRRGHLIQLDVEKINELDKSAEQIVHKLSKTGVYRSKKFNEIEIGTTIIYYNNIPLLPITLDKEERCLICYQYTSYGVQCAGCGYTFHFDQLLDWIALERSCPVCRHNLIVSKL